MAVVLTISSTINGSNYADVLAGGSTGVDIGTVTNGQVSSTKELIIRHDGVSKITGLSYYSQVFTGTYGGDYSAAADFAKLLAWGDKSPTRYGLQFEETWNAGSPFGSPYNVYTGAGDSYANRRTMQASSMSYESSGSEADPSAPVAGEINVASNKTTAGNRAHLKQRVYVPGDETAGGKRQFDLVFAYFYTT